MSTRFIAFVAALLLLSMTAISVDSLWAQTAADEAQVIVTVGAGGAMLWDEDGELITEFQPGVRLIATQRSTNGDWLYVQADDVAAGWASAASVIAFNTQRLPAQPLNLRPVTPTPSPTVAGTETTATPAATEQPSAAQPSAAQETQPDTGMDSPSSDAEATARVNLQSGNLNIRSGPGTSYAIIGQAQAGQQLGVLGRNTTGDWVQVAAPETTAGSGWVSAQYLAVSNAVDDLPVAEEMQEATENELAEDVSDPLADPPDVQPAAASNAADLAGKLVLQTSWGSDISVFDFATGELRLLTGGFDPAISPDGTQVAFTRLGGEHGIYLINIDGSNERRIFGERNEFFSPKWSPDGQSLVFMRTDSTFDCELCIPEELRRKFPWYRVRPRLARVDANGQNYLDIASLDTATSPDWNSAGVVYSSDAGIQITTPTSRDENRRVIFDIRQQYYQDPDWQPDGGRIVYHQRRAGRWALFGINPDGSGRVELNPPPTALVDAMPSNVSAAWSPDGRHIAFLSNRMANNSAGAWGVWVMNADGSNPRRLPIDLPFEYNYVDEQMIDWGR